jgi:hypothetical protein
LLPTSSQAQSLKTASDTKTDEPPENRSTRYANNGEQESRDIAVATEERIDHKRRQQSSYAPHESAYQRQRQTHEKPERFFLALHLAVLSA